jgi:hypothetical protein
VVNSPSPATEKYQKLHLHHRATERGNYSQCRSMPAARFLERATTGHSFHADFVFLCASVSLW